MRAIQAPIAILVLCCVLSYLGYAGQISVCPSQDVGMSPEKLGQVSTAVQGLVDEEKIAGASVLVARKGKVVFFETFGMMDKEAGKPVGEDTIFRFYSMTKPVTSVAVMMLYEQGKIKLDEPVSKYIDSFKDLKVYDESGTPVEPTREMTVRDLLRHTSGLTYGFFGNTVVDKIYRETGVLDRETTLNDMAEKLGEIPLLHQPGTRWHYSVSTDVLGHLVERVSGESLEAFFQSRIFKPLAMKDTAFYVPSQKVDRFAACYGPMPGKGLRVSDNPLASQFLKRPGLLSGGGGLVSTVGDYLRFCSMLLNKGELDGKRLLHAETVEMMTKNQLPESVSWNGQGFGLGFSVRITEGKYGPGEYGWGGAASTHFWIHPKHKLIVIALSQRMPFSSQLQNVVKPLVYESLTSTGLKGSYACNGRLHVGVFGAPDSEPITAGPADMKPSWSKTGDMLVFFRVTKFARDIPDWKTAICVVNVDGTGFHKLTDGTHTDFNPTWTRDGSNLAVLNRQKPNRGYIVMLAKPNGQPGEEYAVSDTSQHTYAYSCLKDGRILVSSSRRPGGYFLMTPGQEGQARYEPIQCELAKKGLLDRVSITPGETKVCFEFQKGFGAYRYSGRTLYIADFDAKKQSISNPKALANTSAKREISYLYPRWTKDESAVVYHCNKTCKNQLYRYRLKDGSTIRVSTDADANYMFPHGEETPK